MNIKTSHIIGFIFTIFIGTIFHYIYEWSGQNEVVALFSAVNESVWEHLKLLFFPALIYAIFEYILYGKNYKNFICAKFISVILGMTFIISAFYIYTGIIGNHIIFIDIIIFIIAVLITYRFSYKAINNDKSYSKNRLIACSIGIMFFIAIFFTFTFNPPKINLFLDTSTNSYGINK